jgi:hypothetical protein
MHKALAGGAVLAALTFAAPASAGCWATVGVAPPPDGIRAGDTWTAKMTVLQHGQRPLPDARTAKPKVRIAKGGYRRTFTAKVTNAAKGRYATRVVFPSAGTWRYRVWDGFTTADGQSFPCARWHTFAPVKVAPAADDASVFPLWPALGGTGALLLGAAAFAWLARRRTVPAPASS